jgi:hypothetical protein
MAANILAANLPPKVTRSEMSAADVRAVGVVCCSGGCYAPVCQTPENHSMPENNKSESKRPENKGALHHAERRQVTRTQRDELIGEHLHRCRFVAGTLKRFFRLGMGFCSD